LVTTGRFQFLTDTIFPWWWFIHYLFDKHRRTKGRDFFADEMTWKLLDKRYKSWIGFWYYGIEGIYTETRNTIQTLDIKSIENGITRQTIGKEKIDTLKKHISETIRGWTNNKITIKKIAEYRIDKIWNYYIFKRKINNERLIMYIKNRLLKLVSNFCLTESLMLRNPLLFIHHVSKKNKNQSIWKKIILTSISILFAFNFRTN
jgi:hypothetical protein